MRSSFVAAALLAAATAFAPAQADVITPVGVEATSTFPFFGQYSKEDLINGSGLAGGLHGSNFDHMWMTDQSVQQAQLTFDLGGLFALDSADIWQFNFGTNTPVISTLDRGVKDFRILTSLDGVSFTEAFAGTMARSADGSPVAAQTFALGGRARFVQIDILNNYVQGTIYENDYASGLSEVRFNGVAVPEPATWAMMIGGFGLVGGAMRSRRRVAPRAVIA